MQDRGDAVDVRIQRSRAALQQALFELTVEKGFANVTVRDIAKRANVNRSTFYRHYTDKYDLLNQYFDQLQREVALAAAQAEAVSRLPVQAGIAVETAAQTEPVLSINAQTNNAAEPASPCDTRPREMTSDAVQTKDAVSAAPIPAGLRLLLEHVRQHAPFYRIMLGKYGDPVFVERFRRLSEQRYRHLFAQSIAPAAHPSSHPPSGSLSEPPTEMRIHYISHAFVGAVLWWLEQDDPCPPDQFAVWLGQLNMTAAGLRA